jgi:hypothetical protein
MYFPENGTLQKFNGGGDAREHEGAAEPVWMSGIGAKAENICSWRAFPVLTQAV